MTSPWTIRLLLHPAGDAGAVHVERDRGELGVEVVDVERVYSSNKILIADEQKEHQLGAVKMVADLQDWGGGEVPGAKLKTVIDSASPPDHPSPTGQNMAASDPGVWCAGIRRRRHWRTEPAR